MAMYAVVGLTKKVGEMRSERVKVSKTEVVKRLRWICQAANPTGEPWWILTIHMSTSNHISPITVATI